MSAATGAPCAIRSSNAKPSAGVARPAAKASGSGTVLGSVPHAQDRHRVRVGYPVNDEVWRRDDQFSCSALTSGPAAPGEQHQTVAGEQQLAADPFGGDRIVGRDVADDPADVGEGLGSPDDRQRSARLGRWSVELAVGEPQQPSADFVVGHRSRVRVRLGDGRRKKAGLGLGFVILGQGGLGCHAWRVAHTPACLHLSCNPVRAPQTTRIRKTERIVVGPGADIRAPAAADRRRACG